MHKAQISVEFFLFVGMAFIIAISFSVYSLQQVKDFQLKNENDAEQDIALKLQKELLIAANVEDGYVREFKIPDKVDNFDYFFNMTNSTITVQSKNSVYFLSIPKVIGNLSKGSNVINKTNGAIYVNS